MYPAICPLADSYFQNWFVALLFYGVVRNNMDNYIRWLYCTICSNVFDGLFFQVLSKEQHELANKNEYNFDHPGWYECSSSD